LPFKDKDDPFELTKQIVLGQVKLNNIDPIARDLLSKILTIEPNIRITLDGIKEHRFFV
jgi:serine/threonine protein kinase